MLAGELKSVINRDEKKIKKLYRIIMPVAVDSIQMEFQFYCNFQVWELYDCVVFVTNINWLIMLRGDYMIV